MKKQNRIVIAGDPRLDEKIPDLTLISKENDSKFYLWSSKDIAKKMKANKLLVKTSKEKYHDNIYFSKLKILTNNNVDLSLLKHKILQILSRIRLLNPVINKIRKHVIITVLNKSNQIWPKDVKVGIIWVKSGNEKKKLGEYRVKLQKIDPGQSMRVTVPITPHAFESKILEPGKYVMWIGLVYEDVAWFHDKGQNAIKLNVNIH